MDNKIVDNLEKEIVDNPKKERFCKICKGKLKKFTKQKDWSNRAYHANCFQEIIRDIAGYQTRAYTKYGHLKRTHEGLTYKESLDNGPITLKFD
tara:strand:+ start:318 stop:599 length:282 start_codon:yes stop_codon:yes gene_type:complete